MGNNTSSNMSNNANLGFLHIYIGPMYAGKTTKLIETYEECLTNDEKVIVLTHSDDIRYSIDKLSNHDQKKICCFKYDKICSCIKEQNDDIMECNSILIDEGQFFDDLYEQVLYLVNVLHKRVYVFGLDGDFQRNKFGQILDLIPHCDTVRKLHSNCMDCNKDAIFSHRIVQSKEQVLIGNNDVYHPLCRSCYNSKYM